MAKVKPESESESMPLDAPMKIEMWSIERPIPYAKNARKWSAEAISKLAASIKEFGWTQPIVCDKSDVIVIGHLRLAAARYLRLTEVPVYVAHNLTPTQVKAARIADNRTHMEATYDMAALGPELLDLKLEKFDLTLTGFDESEIIESVFGGGKKKRKDDKGAGDLPDGLEFRVVVDCQSESHQAELLTRFKREGLHCRALIS